MEINANSYYLSKEEPIKSCLLALKDIIMNFDNSITSEWKYGMPFFCFEGKMFCYLWVDKKTAQPYIGIVEGNMINDPDLIREKRSRMKIFNIDPEIDLPVKKINSLLKTMRRVHNEKYNSSK